MSLGTRHLLNHMALRGVGGGVPCLPEREVRVGRSVTCVKMRDGRTLVLWHQNYLFTYLVVLRGQCLTVVV